MAERPPRSSGRRCIVATLATFVVAVALPLSANGSATIGSDLTGAGAIEHNCGTGGCTIVQTVFPGRPLKAPFAGLIVRWRVKDSAGPLTLRVVRQVSSTGPPWTFAFLRSSAQQMASAPGIDEFAANPPLPIAAGDGIGITEIGDGFFGTSGASGAHDAVFDPTVADGTTVDSFNIDTQNVGWLVNADVVAPPTSTGASLACPGPSGASVTVTADPDPATAPKAVHFKVDGGPEQVAATSGSPGAALVGLPPGAHSLEFWGEDQLGQLEGAHHLIFAGCPALKAVVSNESETATRWRLGSSLATISRARPPVGTTFRFTLDEAAPVRLDFTQSVPGRKVAGHCVRQTRRNAGKRRCKRRVVRGTLSFQGHAGVNSVHFEGRISPTRKLTPGRYSLVITATTPGVGSSTGTLGFSIVR